VTDSPSVGVDIDATLRAKPFQARRR
jgi:hypothetical protein